MWPQLADALAAAQQGDGTGLLALFDEYYERHGDGTWGNSLEAFQMIVCMDSTERPTVEPRTTRRRRSSMTVAPRFAPGTTGSYFCTFFPTSTDPRVDDHRRRRRPDRRVRRHRRRGDAARRAPATWPSTLEDGRLVVIDADQHTCYGATDCADQIIDDYLVNLDVPPDETDCAPAPDDATDGDDQPSTTTGTT